MIETPTSPNRSGKNFSYPAVINRHVPANLTNGQTLTGLKATVAGIHGAGETLRGTLNGSVDRRFHASPETIAANEAVTRQGAEEIEYGHLSHHGKRDLRGERERMEAEQVERMRREREVQERAQRRMR